MTTMRDDATKISVSWMIPAVVAAACILVGIGLGFAAPPVCRWAVDTLPTVPGPVELLSELTTAWSLPILTILGIVGGVVLAMSTLGESLTVTVDSDGVLLEQDDDALYVPRNKIVGAHLDEKDLVLTDVTRRELARRKFGDLDKIAVAHAFTEHGYPWTDTSHNDDEFTRWIDGDPSLDSEIHALLRERRTALSRKDSHVAGQLHGTLQERGIVVRDRKERQEYRRVPLRGGGPAGLPDGHR
ncbi:MULTISPECIES: YqeB family protein [unclassified Rhodococcus (in: high G+C Gram-positive bacteria)]|uniref:YqeB family protein n=1 Tax=Rhodococcus sp. SJ-3 TaxID=3454628 RepID=UPI003F78D9E4